VNWKNDDGTFGINASATYSSGKTLGLGNNTTRWAQAFVGDGGRGDVQLLFGQHLCAFHRLRSGHRFRSTRASRAMA
jgi:hypothetical protein